MACPSLTKLIIFLQNHDARSERSAIYDHFSTRCPDCHKNLPWVKMVLAEIAKHQLLSPSVENLRWLGKILTTVAEDESYMLKEQTATGLQSMHQYIAKLIFDSGGLPQLVEARLRSKEPLVRRKLYQAEGYNIDLKFTWSNKSNDERLDGQVLLKDCGVTTPAQVKVELLQRGSVVFSTTTDEYGVFEFYRLTPGIYEMKITVPDGEINLTRVSTAYAL
jgi:hypothetical protein